MRKTPKLTKLTFMEVDHRHDVTERWMRRIIQRILIQALELPTQDVADFLWSSRQDNNQADAHISAKEH
ncbi:hypothetical protein [Ferroacidibacillus organovorans]|uniref:Uncharacterized protein n=1 Tax=Ferroacidibacillus organovorans TaxID=1765683 RepID=A0A853KAQ2_9BACL|nr:hypothetical protein [Ferroacidibacillus organovorans]KYP81656.1 hypothetical protein AYJ22_06415 [Ferroacidibacillus organovorans]OAG94145.1 hypothetical protein AYW79_06905 [Ferroacidibacillus organovorans]